MMVVLQLQILTHRQLQTVVYDWYTHHTADTTPLYCKLTNAIAPFAD